MEFQIEVLDDGCNLVEIRWDKDHVEKHKSDESWHWILGALQRAFDEGFVAGLHADDDAQALFEEQMKQAAEDEEDEDS